MELVSDKPKGGKKSRTPKFDEVKRARFIELVESGTRRGTAAKAVGVGYDTVWRAMKSDQDFADAVSAAEMHADEAVENALYQAALGGNVVACQVWLYNRQPERWRDQRSRMALAPQVSEDGEMTFRIVEADSA